MLKTAVTAVPTVRRTMLKFCCYLALVVPALLGCRQPKVDTEGGDAIITVKVRVVSYDADAAHNTVSTPDGETYHADMYDAAYCKIASKESDLPDPFVIWGWNRTEYVPESLRTPDTTATITFERSAIEDTPFGDGIRGIRSTAISKIAID